MFSRDDYDKKIDDLKTKLGDNFNLVSDIVAELSTDYDTVIQADKNYQDEIQGLKDEKVQLLETNNKLFTQVTSKTKENDLDDVLKGEVKKQEDEEKIQNISIDDVLDEKGGLN